MSPQILQANPHSRPVTEEPFAISSLSKPSLTGNSELRDTFWDAETTALLKNSAHFRFGDAFIALGFQEESLDYTGIEDPKTRVARLDQRLADETSAVILAGSSMGGYVSAVAACKRPVSGLFLLAPALHMPGYAVQTFPPLPCPTTVIHGWRDAIIPWQHSVRFAESQRAELHLLDGDHCLNDCLDHIETERRQSCQFRRAKDCPSHIRCNI